MKFFYKIIFFKKNLRIKSKRPYFFHYLEFNFQNDETKQLYKVITAIKIDKKFRGAIKIKIGCEK